MMFEQIVVVIVEVELWVNMLYYDYGRLKGVGVDCVMFLLEVYNCIGIVIIDDLGFYFLQFGLYYNEEFFFGFVECYVIEVVELVLGGCVLFCYGCCYLYGGIMVLWMWFIYVVKCDCCVVYSDFIDIDLIDCCFCFFMVEG